MLVLKAPNLMSFFSVSTYTTFGYDRCVVGDTSSISSLQTLRLTGWCSTLLKMADDRNRTKQTDVPLISNGEDIDVAINGKVV